MILSTVITWSSVSFLGRGLLVVFGFEDFGSTHGADALLVRAVLAVFGVYLVDLLLANPALLKPVTSQGIETVLLLGGQKFVLTHFATTVRGLIPRSALPGVSNNYLETTKSKTFFMTSNLKSTLDHSLHLCT